MSARIERASQPPIATSGKINVLLVEDSVADAELIFAHLDMHDARRDVDLKHVKRLSEAVEVISSSQFDVVFLDLGLPDSSGLQGLEKIREIAPSLPIVVMTGLADESVSLKALKTGAQDYVVKGRFDGKSLVRAARHAIERQQLLVKLDERRESASFQATHDKITGLPNRTFLEAKVRELIQNSASEREHRKGGVREPWQGAVAILFMDLDGFKNVNDTYGHAVGDSVLREVAARLQLQVRETDFVARQGGDEFVVLVNPARSREEVEGVAKRIIDAIVAIDQVDNCDIDIATSVGIASYPQHSQDADELMQFADAAMYSVKRDGKRGLCWWSESVASAPAHINDDASLDVTVDQLGPEQIELSFRPWLAADGRLALAEVRLAGLIGNPVLDPGEFLRAASVTGTRVKLGQSMFLTAANIINKLDAVPHIGIVSSLDELNDPRYSRSWVDALRAMSENANLHSVKTKLLICETALSPISRMTKENLESLAARDVDIVVTGFGVRDASFAMLERLPVSGVKLDKSLTNDISEFSERKLALLESIISFCRKSKIYIVAGGITKSTDLARLKRMECDAYEGSVIAPEQGDLQGLITGHA